MIRNQPEANSFKLASILGNNSKDPEKVIEFLQTLSTAEIVEAQYKVLTPEVKIIFYIFYFTLHSKIELYHNISLNNKYYG